MSIQLTEKSSKEVIQLSLTYDLFLIYNIFRNFGANNINLLEMFNGRLERPTDYQIINERDKALAEKRVGFISACSPTEVSYYPIFGDSNDEYYATELKFAIPIGKEPKDYNKGDLMIGDYVVQGDEIIDFIVYIILKINPSYYWLLSDKMQQIHEDLKPNYKKIYDYRVYHIVRRDKPTEDEMQEFLEEYTKTIDHIFLEKENEGTTRK